MSVSPAEIFERYFGELEQREIPYAILHSYERLPDEIGSDVDYAVPQERLSEIAGIKAEVAAAAGWVLVQALQHEICACYYVLIDPERPEHFIKLDVCSHYARNGAILVRDRDLLDDPRRYRGFFVPSPSSEFAYVLTKALAKGKDVATFLPRLHGLWRQEPDRAQQLLGNLLGTEFSDFPAWAEDAPAKRDEFARRVERRCKYRARERIAELARRVRRLRYPTGLQISLLGPDGAGKSTVLAAMLKTLEPCFRCSEVFHSRPMLLHDTSSRRVVSDPHREPPRNRWVGYGKVGFYWFDHIAGFFGRILPAITHSTLVVFDRNFDDLLIDPRRYRICGASGFVRLLGRILPQSSQVFVLDAEPEVIHRRKPELSLMELARQRSELRALAERRLAWTIISVDRRPEEVSQDLCERLINTMAKRTAQRLCRPVVKRT